MKLLISLITLLSFFSYEKVELVTGENSTITIKGTSSLHDWTMVSNQIRSHAVVYANKESVKVESFEGSIAVTSLKSDSGQMDKNAYKTLNSDKYPEITFNLVKVIKSNSETQLITVLFDVAISGNTQQLEIEASAIPVGDDAVQIKGSKSLQMTDFGIKPPSFMFGALKVGNDITVDFNLNLAVTSEKLTTEVKNF